MELVLATKNMGKIRELRSLLHSIPNLEILTLYSFSNYSLPAETGHTFQENAMLKAEDAACALKKWVLADDSGLVVPALQGKLGVYSHRFAGEQATDGENRKKLLKSMEGFVDDQRYAYYECTLALAGPSGLYKIVTATCEGLIAEQERGCYGFGYDTLFSKHDYGEKTFGELSENIKNKISHRAKAVEKMFPVLFSLAND